MQPVTSLILSLQPFTPTLFSCIQHEAAVLWAAVFSKDDCDDSLPFLLKDEADWAIFLVLLRH
jgi:hypothetical protein